MADKQNLAKESQLALKQDTLIAGANITIAPDGKTISAAGPTSITVTPIYQAGTLVAAIVVNGNTTNIYAPAQHGDNSNQNLAAPFSASATYAVGDYVIYQENLYKCITAITTAAAWDATKWTRVLITNEMGSGSGGDYANQNIADTYDITATYDVGDYVIFNSLLYKCITAVTTPGVWNSSYWAHVLVTNEMGSGGGSSVIPNPQDPATDTLTKIGINGTVYDIAGGGGGSGYTETTLWSGNETPSTAGTDINLSGNISGYDAIAIHVGNNVYSGDNVFLVSSLTIGETYISTIYHGENLGAYFTYTSDTQINIMRQATSYPQIYTKVVGIKYGEGGGGSGTTVVPNPSNTPTDTLNTIQIDDVIYDLGGGSGSSYSETMLWSGTQDSTEEGISISLSDDINNFDAIIIDCGRQSENAYRHGYIWYLVSGLSIESWYLQIINTNDNCTAYWKYASNTSITWASAYIAYPVTLFSIKGVNFGGSGGGSFDGLDWDNAETLTLPDTTGYTYTPSCEGVIMLTTYGSVGGITIKQTGYNDIFLSCLSDTWTTTWIPVTTTEYTLKKTSTIYTYPQDSWVKFIPWKTSGGGGGGNSNDRELTWDEYQALPDAEKYNDTNYYITDVNSDGTSNEFQPIIYSENEREIGVWIDGKPLYQKVWIFDPYISIGTSFSTTSNINSTDINDVIYVYSLHEDGTGYCDMMADPTMTNHTELGLKASDTHNITRLILQYTKISDAAGSGTWTPQGVPTVHYDSNEKVIGTWFGETLYEKSYELTLPNSYDGQDGFIIDSDGSFIDKLISCEGSAVDVNGCITNMGGLNAAGWHLNLHRNPYNVLLLYGSESPAFGGGTAHVTIRYTKSSS